MFKWSKEICKKISDSNCLSKNEMQMVEIALRLYECYEEILNENLGLDFGAKEKKDFFQLEHAIHRNSSQEQSIILGYEGSSNTVGYQCKGVD